MELILKNLKTAIFKVVEMMFFLLTDGKNNKGCSIYIGITGNPDYLITFSCHEDIAIKMAVDLLGTCETEVDEKVIQFCLEETANIIAGNFLHSFSTDENRNLTSPCCRKEKVFGKYKKLEEEKLSVSYEGNDVNVIIEAIEKTH